MQITQWPEAHGSLTAHDCIPALNFTGTTKVQRFQRLSLHWPRGYGKHTTDNKRELHQATQIVSNKVCNTNCLYTVQHNCPLRTESRPEQPRGQPLYRARTLCRVAEMRQGGVVSRNLVAVCCPSIFLDNSPENSTLL